MFDVGVGRRGDMEINDMDMENCKWMRASKRVKQIYSQVSVWMMAVIAHHKRINVHA